ncbi:MAG: hypothetical protein Q3M30_11830 [Candidatus Electrothrix sp. Rat3]|nr:hypothetical protein [Candidatus Electrothrix rattekaaiensis]
MNAGGMLSAAVDYLPGGSDQPFFGPVYRFEKAMPQYRLNAPNLRLSEQPNIKEKR